MLIQMTKKMPPQIKKFFLYRTIWNDVYKKDSNAMVAIIGKPGRGKSTMGLRIAEDLDPTFNVNRVCYSVSDLLKLLKFGDPDTGKIIPGQVIMFDELVNEQGGYSRTALSKHNQIMAFITANLRAKRIILILCLPKFTQLDKDIREVGLTAVLQMKKIDFNRKKSYAELRWICMDEMRGNNYSPFPRLVDKDGNLFFVKGVWMKKCSKELETEYKKKKMGYMENSIDKWYYMLHTEEGKTKALSSKDIAKKVIKNPEKYQTNGKFDYIKVMTEYDLGDQASRNITKMAKALSV